MVTAKELSRAAGIIIAVALAYILPQDVSTHVCPLAPRDKCLFVKRLEIREIRRTCGPRERTREVPVQISYHRFVLSTVPTAHRNSFHRLL